MELAPAEHFGGGAGQGGTAACPRALELAVEKGCRFDGWSEEFDLETWLGVLSEAGLSAKEYLRPREIDELLPWAHISIGVSRQYLLRERARALEERHTADCRGGRLPGLRGVRFQDHQAGVGRNPAQGGRGCGRAGRRAAGLPLPPGKDRPGPLSGGIWRP